LTRAAEPTHHNIAGSALLTVIVRSKVRPTDDSPAAIYHPVTIEEILAAEPSGVFQGYKYRDDIGVRGRP
jgi:hypothetical protein